MANDGFDRVKALLEKYPAFRDSDNMLMAHIWREDLSYKLNVLSAHELLVILASSENLSKWGAMTRYRREVQELFPDLRGKKYTERQEKQIGVVTEMKEIKSGFDEKFGPKYDHREGDLFRHG